MKHTKLLLSISLLLGSQQLVGGPLEDQLVSAIDQYEIDFFHMRNPNLETMKTLLNQGADPEVGLNRAIKFFSIPALGSMFSIYYAMVIIELFLQKGAKNIAASHRNWLKEDLTLDPQNSQIDAQNSQKAKALLDLLKKYNINI